MSTWLKSVFASYMSMYMIRNNRRDGNPDSINSINYRVGDVMTQGEGTYVNWLIATFYL